MENNENDMMNNENSGICREAPNIDRGMYTGMPEPPQRGPQRNTGGIVLTAFLAALLMLSAAAALLSIVSDLVTVMYSDGQVRERFILSTFDRPSNDSELKDENGRYTVEGVTQLMKPSIVEIYVYKSSFDSRAVGSGSGIIISDDGYIVTNSHVIENTEKYMVTTSDGKQYAVELKGRDSKTDIAVIKINADSKLSPAQIGNSDQIIQGEQVVAVGNPAGLTGSVSSGIVSGLDRKIRSDAAGYEMNCIQTDAAISPGNSGGALVNMYGQVIGITSSKYAAMTTEGLGFAITVNDAKPIIEELISQGYVSGRVRIGIRFYTDYAGYSEAQFKKKFGFEMPSELKDAVWIEEISEDCDISNTELRPDDFIVSIDGKKTGSYDEVQASVEGKKGGDKLKARCARVDKKGKVEYFDIEFELMTDKSGNF